MHRTAAWLARHALEQLGIRFTFGIPGVHNTELYDALGASESITPVLVAHEGGGAFMADAVSRTGAGVGALLIVPAAGVTHAASGIGEASLDGIPMLVIAGGIRRDLGRAYQLHDMDQHALLAPITKGRWRVDRHADVVPVIYEAYRLATSGEPGPVFIEIPVNLQLMPGDTGDIPAFVPAPAAGHRASDANLARAAELLMGGRSTRGSSAAGARWMQGRSFDSWPNRLARRSRRRCRVFPPFRQITRCMRASRLGPRRSPQSRMRFATATACSPSERASRKFRPAATATSRPRISSTWTSTRACSVRTTRPRLRSRATPAPYSARSMRALGAAPGAAARRSAVAAQVAADKRRYREEWLAHDSKDRVNPQRFFDALRRRLPDDGIVVADDGNHTFLIAELMPIHAPRAFFSPSDFNSMGYCIPAVIGAKLARPDRTVVGIVGDGAARMTGLEMATAVAQKVGVVWFIFNDGELAQIAQAQETPYNRKTCTVLPELDFEGLAKANRVGYRVMRNDSDIDRVIGDALAAAAAGEPVLVDVRIDYSRRTRFTEGVIRTNLKRFGLADQARLVGRALWRRLTG